MNGVRLPAIALMALVVAGCAASPGATIDEREEIPSEEVAVPEPLDEPQVAVVGNGCALLDDEYLDTTLAGVESTFGGALDFQPHAQAAPSEFCSWKDVTGAMSIQLKLEDAATAAIDDHSGRAYNMDVEPLVEPQDGPGEYAVILVDTAFADVREGFAYGYFFVQDGVAVFITTVGLEIGRDMLRVVADEASARLAAL